MTTYRINPYTWLDQEHHPDWLWIFQRLGALVRNGVSEAGDEQDCRDREPVEARGNHERHCR